MLPAVLLLSAVVASHTCTTLTQMSTLQYPALFCTLAAIQLLSQIQFQNQWHDVFVHPC